MTVRTVVKAVPMTRCMRYSRMITTRSTIDHNYTTTGRVINVEILLTENLDFTHDAIDG